MHETSLLRGDGDVIFAMKCVAVYFLLLVSIYERMQIWVSNRAILF